MSIENENKYQFITITEIPMTILYIQMSKSHEIIFSVLKRECLSVLNSNSLLQFPVS